MGRKGRLINLIDVAVGQSWNMYMFHLVRAELEILTKESLLLHWQNRFPVSGYRLPGEPCRNVKKKNM